VESSPTTFGGAAALEWAPIAALSSVAMRAGASLRAGSLQDGSGSTLTFAPGIGLRWGFLAPAERRPLGASMHVEYLAVYQTVSHPSPGSSATRGTLLSGLGAVVDADLRISPGADLSVGVGFEEVFSPTYIVVGTATTGMLPATRALAEAGVRLAL
jgi:Flp pilus assembly pilin Flp